MSDKEARVLAAGDTINVSGKDYRISPVGMKHLHEVQRAAVKYYKREYLTTFAENLDLLPKDQAAKLLEKKLEEVARWDIGNLPIKMAFDVQSVPVTNEKLLTLLEDSYGDLPENELARRAVLAAALDAETIDPAEVEKLTGVKPRRVRVPYDSWWVTATRDGMISFVLASVQKNHPELTADDVGDWPLGKIMEAARLVESLTAPSLGNM